MGALVGNMLKGSPAWVLLIGPPASGRTILLETLAGLPKVHLVSLIKGPSALLSGTGKKDCVKGSTGGLLRQVGNMGMLVIKDFTSILSLPHEPLMETLGAFREVYDGRWSRALGADGGRVLEWEGKCGLIGACTPAIDQYHAVIRPLGERWMYYRYAESDGYGESKKVMATRDPEACMLKMREAVSEFLEQTGAQWEDGGLDRRELGDVESNRMFAMSSFVVAARSPVVRDYHTKEIVDVSQREAPTRLAASLTQLYLGMELAGLPEDERWRILGKVALDSMPQLRLKVIEALVTRGEKSGGLKEILQCSSGTIRRVTEDLVIHGIIEKLAKKDRTTAEDGSSGLERGASAGSFKITQWGRKQLGLGWRKP
jgi:hypothetical protein